MQHLNRWNGCGGDKNKVVDATETKRLTQLHGQVLFKRKPVQYLPQTVIEDDSSEVWISIIYPADFPADPFSSFQVWVIPETNEVFTSYEPYLQRMDFYKQRRFICEITGHSGLTFFEALRSEVHYNTDTKLWTYAKP